jgi:hypothetical protein
MIAILSFYGRKVLYFTNAKYVNIIFQHHVGIISLLSKIPSFSATFVNVRWLCDWSSPSYYIHLFVYDMFRPHTAVVMYIDSFSVLRHFKSWNKKKPLVQYSPSKVPCRSQGPPHHSYLRQGDTLRTSPTLSTPAPWKCRRTVPHNVLSTIMHARRVFFNQSVAVKV